MNINAAAFAVAMLASPASAGCFGSGSFQTCTDDAGNSYSVQRFGNTTMMNGFNTETGSTWSQQSQTYGNTTQHNGIAGNGQPWSMTEQSLGGSTTYSGIDSGGNTFFTICNQFGCN